MYLCIYRYFKTIRKGSQYTELNIQSIDAEFNEFYIFINCILKKSVVKIICLRETWLTNNCSLALDQLPNYNLVSRGKSCCQRGGLLIYIHDSLKYEIIDESENMSNWECLSLKKIG